MTESTGTRLFFLTMNLILVSSFNFGQVTTTLNADGPGDTYELINSVWGSGAASEIPDLHLDCNPNSARHIREDWDSTLNKYVFLFDIHVDDHLDYDRCANTDRQRNEIKTVSPNNVTGQQGETHIYKWKFKMDSAFQASPNFCHLHQIKATGGSDAGAPIITITPRDYTGDSQPEWLQLIFTPSSGGSGGGILHQVELLPLKGIWLDVTQKVIYGDEGKYELTIRVPDSTVVMQYSNYFLDMFRAGANFHRGKWGIYRSLNTAEVLRDETVAFADFSITEGEVNTPPSTPDNLTATVISDRQIDLTWNDNSDNETNFKIQRSLDGVLWTTISAVNSDTTSYSVKGLQDSTTYYFRVRAENWNAYSEYTDSVEATTLSANIALSPAWFDQDIGITTPVGSATDTSGFFIIEGAGSDVYGTSDHFHYVFQALSGDGEITARVDSVEHTHDWAKTGVMVRETLDDDSPHAMNIVTPINGINLQYRTIKGGSSSSISGSDSNAPRWIRLSRKGDTFTAFESSDIISWDSIGTVTIPMANTVYSGLMLTSHNGFILATSKISNVSVSTDTTGDTHIWIEAESGDLNSPMNLKEDYTASAGHYVITDTGRSTSEPPLDGHITYNFNVVSDTVYKIWIRTQAPTREDDSFWFKLDDNDWFPMNEVEPSTEWIWNEVHNSDSENVVVTYNLAEGHHTLTVAYREDGTLLDKFLITSDISFNPNPDVGTVEITEEEKTLPEKYILNNSYPNPFNPTTNLSYILPQASKVKLIIYDIMGREVTELVNEFQQAGKYGITWNAKDSSGRQLASGTYFARIEAGSFTKVVKLMLLK